MKTKHAVAKAVMKLKFIKYTYCLKLFKRYDQNLIFK